MKIKIKDIDKFEKNEALYGLRFYNTNDIYEVYSIIRYKKELRYLTCVRNRVWQWKSDAFEVVDNVIPDNWIEIEYKSFHKLKNKKYNFSLPITHYHGPKEFLENENFLFDIYEEFEDAYEFFDSYMKSKGMSIE